MARGARSAPTPASGHAGSGHASGARAAASPIAQTWSGKTGTLADPPAGPPGEEVSVPEILVVDTNVALKAYLEEDLADEAEAILDAGLSEETTLVAPSLILPEFRHALDKRRRRGELSADEAEEIWNEFAGYPIFLEELDPLMPAAVEVVRVCGCTVYDAIFVALAETGSEERLALITADERLMRTLEGTPYAGLVLALGKVGGLL